MTIIPESDVYRLIFRSKLPTAERFEAWVMEEILPTIRKTGGYLVASKDDTPEVIMARAVLVAQDTIKRISAELAEVKPKAALVDATFANRHHQPLRLTEVVRKLDGVNTQAIKRNLLNAGYLYHTADQYRVRGQYRGPDKLFVEKLNPYTFKQDIYATVKGAALIGKMYYEGKLTMKVGRESSRVQ